MVKDAGAKEVYFVSACPPVKHPCYYGVDMPTYDELIVNSKNGSDKRILPDILGVDILLYQEIDDLVEAVTRRGDHHIKNPCMACLDGHYVVNGRKVHDRVGVKA
jgi:amidophosphoribosyltransferase